MTNFDEYRDVFVVADTIDDVVHPVTYELIGQARRIAKELGHLLYSISRGDFQKHEQYRRHEPQVPPPQLVRFHRGA